ncbi:MAG: phage holin family protein [Firmicutes bacterium]|nr:phage holin family protein [Bacillota bacterium]MDY4106809.1 phage holin family protein [Oscillospiraceae bacterium]
MEAIMETITQFSVPVIVGICLCVGYVLKNIVPTDKVNRFIPLIMAALGLALNVWIHMGISPEIILGGLFSGLSSTGLYEAFRNLIKK